MFVILDIVYRNSLDSKFLSRYVYSLAVSMFGVLSCCSCLSYFGSFCLFFLYLVLLSLSHCFDYFQLCTLVFPISLITYSVFKTPPAFEVTVVLCRTAYFLLSPVSSSACSPIQLFSTLHYVCLPLNWLFCRVCLSS